MEHYLMKQYVLYHKKRICTLQLMELKIKQRPYQYSKYKQITKIDRLIKLMQTKPRLRYCEIGTTISNI